MIHTLPHIDCLIFCKNYYSLLRQESKEPYTSQVYQKSEISDSKNKNPTKFIANHKKKKPYFSPVQLHGRVCDNI